MRKLIKIAASAVGLFSLFLAGCSDIDSDDSATVSGGTNSASSTKEITLNVSSNSDLVRFEAEDTSLSANVVRNISPDALKATGLKFYFGGKNLQTGANLAVQEVAFKAKVTKDDSNDEVTSQTEGTVKVDLDPANYSFVLVAYDSAATQPDEATLKKSIEDLVGGAVLIAYANVDLRYTSSVSFFLSSDGLKGKSNVELDLYLDNWSDSSKEAKVSDNTAAAKTTDEVDIYLADMNTGDRIYPTSGTKKLTDKDGSSAANCETVKWDGIDFVGTYNLVFAFTVNGKVFKYSEPIDLLANQTTKKKYSSTEGENKAIPVKDILKTKPKKPSDFVVGYEEPESSELETAYYKAVFNWKDESDSEDYFEIQLREITDIDNEDISSQLSAWSSTSTDVITTYNNNFYRNVENNWYAGSLLTNNTKAVFALPLGKKYLARIRAYNALSSSGDNAKDEWVYATNATDASPAKFTGNCITKKSLETSTPLNITGKAFATSGIINLFRIRYHFNGADTKEPSSLTEKKAYFFSQVYKSDNEAEGVAIMNPDGIGINAAPYETGEITLKKGAAPWTNWNVGSTSVTDRYPDKFEKVETFDSAVSSYKKEATGTDLNGRPKYVLASPQPTTLGSDDYKSAGEPATYRGFENLDLYANFTNTEFSVEIRNSADYNIENNMDIKIQAKGSGDYPAKEVVKRDASGKITESNNFDCTLTTYYNDGTTVSKYISSIEITCTPVTGAITYDSIFVTLSDNTETEKYNKSVSSTSTEQTFTIPVSDLQLTPGSYLAKVCATTPAKELVVYNIFIKIKDSETSTETAPSSGNGGTNP